MKIAQRPKDWFFKVKQTNKKPSKAKPKPVELVRVAKRSEIFHCEHCGLESVVKQ